MQMIIFKASLIFGAAYIIYRLIKFKINKTRENALVAYKGDPLLEFLSGFFDKRINPKLNVNINKIPNKPCLFLMNHLDVTDPVFIQKIIKLQKNPRQLIYVATTEFNKFPGLKKFLESAKCIFVEFLDPPAGLTENQCKMSPAKLASSNLSDTEKQAIKEFQAKKKIIAEKVIDDTVSRLKDGNNMFVFPTGTFDHYKHNRSLIRRVRPGAAKAILKGLEQDLDADVVILKKLGVPAWVGGSFFWSLPYMIMGGSRKATMTLEAVIPLSFFKHPLIQNSKNPTKLISALYASFMSTEYTKSPSGKYKLEIDPIPLDQQEYQDLIKLRQELKDSGYCGDAVKDKSIAKNNKEFGYQVSLEENPFLSLPG